MSGLSWVDDAEELDRILVAAATISAEEAARAWATYERLPDGAIREIFFDQEKDPGPRATFAGFCDPCGGFRKHRLGCPVVRPDP